MSLGASYHAASFAGCITHAGEWRDSMPDFMVLRNTTAVRTASPFEIGPTTASAPNVPEPQVELHNVPESEAIDIARDPQVVAVAKPMPTTLIKPLEVAGAAATSAWGIAAVKADTSNF